VKKALKISVYSPSRTALQSL